MKEIIVLLLWLIPIAANVYMDRKGRKPNYIQMFLLRGMAAILHAILFNPHNVYDWLPILIFQVTSFWLIFEIALNLVRGKHFLYYDHLEGDSGYIDRFFAWAGEKFHAVCKMLCFAVMVWSIIVILHRAG